MTISQTLYLPEIPQLQAKVALLCRRLNLESWEQNQLEKRKGFWANYSDRFERIRILLPRSSATVLGSVLNHQDVSFLIEDGSKPTEVCIFDLGDWFVIEFFRGPGSETRLFRRNLKIESELFDSSQLSIKRLRCLGGEVHDHVYCWQSDCEKWLRNKNILPNEGTEYFKGLPRQYNQYNSNTGLPSLLDEQRQQRQWKLTRWQKDIENLEKDSGKSNSQKF